MGLSNQAASQKLSCALYPPQCAFFTGRLCRIDFVKAAALIINWLPKRLSGYGYGVKTDRTLHRPAHSAASGQDRSNPGRKSLARYKSESRKPKTRLSHERLSRFELPPFAVLLRRMGRFSFRFADFEFRPSGFEVYPSFLLAKTSRRGADCIQPSRSARRKETLWNN